MRFDPYKSIQIETSNTSSCIVRHVANDLNTLQGIKRLLAFHQRSSGLEGGTPLNFSITENFQFPDPHLLITGDLIEIISAVYNIGYCNEAIKQAVFKQIISAMLQRIPLAYKRNFLNEIQSMAGRSSIV